MKNAPKTYRGYRVMQRGIHGQVVNCQCVVTVESNGKSRPLNPRLDIRNHSPGAKLADMLSVVMLDMAIGTKQLEPFGVIFNVGKPTMLSVMGKAQLPAPILLCGRIGVVEMQGRETPVIAATLASAAKPFLDRSEAGAFSFSPSSLLAFRAKVLPSLVSRIRERSRAPIAKPDSFEVNTGALMLSFPWSDLSAIDTAPFAEALQAVPCHAVGPIGDSLVTAGAVEGGIRSHDSPSGMYYCSEYSIQSVNATHHNFEWGYGGSGPAQLALAIIADCCGRRMAIPAIYQPFKRRVIAGLPKDGWEMSEAIVKAFVDEVMKDRDVASILRDE